MIISGSPVTRSLLNSVDSLWSLDKVHLDLMKGIFWPMEVWISTHQSQQHGKYQWIVNLEICYQLFFRYKTQVIYVSYLFQEWAARSIQPVCFCLTSKAVPNIRTAWVFILVLKVLVKKKKGLHAVSFLTLRYLMLTQLCFIS